MFDQDAVCLQKISEFTIKLPTQNNITII
jgi:hypothetical protein